MANQDEIKRRNGDPKEILNGLASESPFFRFQALCGAVNNNVFEEKIIDQIKLLIEDDERIIGYSISMLAKAALEKAGIMKYDGDDERIKMLIDSEIWFDVK